MSDTKERRPTAIEVWLSKPNIEITCAIVHDDETTTSLSVDSLSMRGAQREITGYLISKGYVPAGRWETEHTGSDGYVGTETLECARQFKPGPDAKPVSEL